MHQNVIITYSSREFIQETGQPRWDSQRYVINNNSVARAIPDREFQTGGGPRDDDRAALQFALWRCWEERGGERGREEGDSESTSGEIFGVMSARRDARIICTSSCVSWSCEIGACRALMMQNRYHGHHYRGLTTPGVAPRRSVLPAAASSAN